MIIDIRGTSGSGKTTVARAVLGAGSAVPIRGDSDGGFFGTGKPECYEVIIPNVPKRVYVLGSYEQTCGGCDSIGTQDEICDLVRKYSQQGHVVMEGLLMSHLFGRYLALDRELDPLTYVWAFLDTPLELCLERVQARREARGVAKKPFNPKNTTQKWHDIRRVREKALKESRDVRDLDHRYPSVHVLEWLKNA